VLPRRGGTAPPSTRAGTPIAGERLQLADLPREDLGVRGGEHERPAAGAASASADQTVRGEDARGQPFGNRDPDGVPERTGSGREPRHPRGTRTAPGGSPRSRRGGFEAGDEARGEASFKYRLVPRGRFGGGVPSYLFAVLDTSAVWRGRDRLSGTADPDSGGFLLYASPGLQWITTRTVVEAAVQIPLIQPTHGRALLEGFTARLSLRVNF